MASQINIPELQRALGGLMDSALMPEQWDGTLEAISRATGSVGTHIMPVRGKFEAGVLTTPNFLEAFDIYFSEGWYKRDFRERGLQIGLTKGVVIEHDIATSSDFSQHAFYADFLARFGMRYSAMVLFQARGTTLSINLQRGIHDAPFDRDDEAALLGMQSSLSSAAELVRTLDAAKVGGMGEAFDMTAAAAIFFDRKGRITHLNARAEGLLDEEIRIAGGELFTLKQSEAAQLQRQVLSAADGALFIELPAIRITRTGKPPLVARVQKLQGFAADLFAHSSVVVLITDLGERDGPSIELLRSTFSLTPQEATVARLLLDGSSPREIATICGLQYETARGYVKRVLSKTGTQRQAQLIALLSGLKP